MSAPSALTVVYPPSFQNSFWSYPSYRRGAQSLYSRLQAGIDENESILAFVAHRAELEYTHAEALATPAPAPSFSAPLFKNAGGLLQDVLSSATSPTSPFVDGPGFGSPNARGFAHNETGASRAFRLIQAETTNAQATAHGKVARSLEGLILNPFGKWAQDHKERITNSWEHVDAALTRFERQKAEVEKLKHNYESKCRQADEAEDDARFAPVEDHLPEPSTPKRSVSAGSGPTALSPEEKPSKPADPETLKRRETIRKQFGFGDRSASASLPKPAKEFAGVKLPTPPAETDDDSPIMKDQSHNSPGATGLKRSGTIGAYLSSAVERIPAPIKAAVGGVVSNEPRHIRLRRDADNAERVYEEAVRNLDRTRCQVEEILYEHYGLTQRWEADRIRAVKSVLVSYNQSLSAIVPGFDRSLARGLQIQDAVNPDLELRALIREARTGPFHPAIERFQPYYHDEISLGRGPAGHSEAVAWMTKNGGFGLDLALVERLDYLEKLEKGADGASASATATHKLGVLPPVLDALLNALERAYKDNDRWPKAPPAVPAKEGEESSDASDSSLLRLSQEKRKAWIYEVPLSVTHRLRDALIAQLSPSHADMIYGSQAPGGDGSKLISDKMLDAYDPPVLAACIKVWLLELDKSLILEDLWDQIDAIYRAAAGQEREALEALRKKQAETKTDADVDAATGEDAEKEETKDEAKDKATTDTGKAAEGPKKIDLATEERIRKGVLEDLGVVLNKLPKIHLASLDAIISHLHRLVKETKTDESDLIYLNKLGLAFGRAFIRPHSETPLTMASRHPTLVVMDLVQHYESIFPALLEQKEASSGSNSSITPDGQRKAPIRKRTKPVDQRISRSSIGRDVEQGARRFMEQVGASPKAPPPVPPVPIELQDSSPTKSAAAPAPALLDTQNLSTEKKDGEDEPTPTPIAQRVLNPLPEDEKPLSNVARLSRQFASGGSSAPRGPRPAGARVPSTKRESQDLAPSTDEKAERRRSWSRTIESSDSLIDD